MQPQALSTGVGVWYPIRIGNALYKIRVDGVDGVEERAASLAAQSGDFWRSFGAIVNRKPSVVKR